MRLTTFAFDARITFFIEKRSKMYDGYIDVSIAEEKVSIAQKILQRNQLCWVAGRIGA